MKNFLSLLREFSGEAIAQDYKCKQPANSLMVIKPYRWEKLWVFDDPSVGLLREALVAGVPEILEGLLEQEGIPLEEAEKGFLVTFSAIPFPGHQLGVTWIGREAGGNWYEENVSKKQGWLCPALLRYFSKPPKNLYIRADRC